MRQQAVNADLPRMFPDIDFAVYDRRREELREISEIISGDVLLAVPQRVVDDINKISTAVKDVPGLGDKVFGTGAFLLMTGAVLKGVAAWRTYAAIQKTATAVAAIERTGEAAKVPIINSEAAAVTKSTGAFNGLRGMLLKAGTATLGVNAAAASTTRILAAGVVTVGLYAVAIAGLV